MKQQGGQASTVLTLGQGKVLPWWWRGGKRMDGTPAPTIAWELRDFIRWLQKMTAPLSPGREVIFFYFAIFHYVVRSFSRFASASPYSLTYGISRTPNNFLVPQLRAENHHKRPTVFSYPSSTLRSISLYFLSPCLNFRAALGCHHGKIGLDETNVTKWCIRFGSWARNGSNVHEWMSFIGWFDQGWSAYLCQTTLWGVCIYRWIILNIII